MGQGSGGSPGWAWAPVVVTLHPTTPPSERRFEFCKFGVICTVVLSIVPYQIVRSERYPRVCRLQQECVRTASVRSNLPYLAVVMDSTRQGESVHVWVWLVEVRRHGNPGWVCVPDTAGVCVWWVVRVGGVGGSAWVGGGLWGVLHPPYFEHARAAWRVRCVVWARLGWVFGPPMQALVFVCVGVCCGCVKEGLEAVFPWAPAVGGRSLCAPAGPVVWWPLV